MAAQQVSRRAVLGTAGGAAVATGAVVFAPVVGANANPPGSTARSVTLVDQGLPDAVIIVEEPEDNIVAEAAEVLRDTVERSSGARLDIIGPDDPVNQRSVVRIGKGPKALRALKRAGVTLEREQFWISVKPREILIAAKDFDKGTPGVQFVARTPATIWGVQRLLDDWMGVRYLWPGEEGTVVPRTDTIQIGYHTLTHRPPYVMREIANQIINGHTRSSNAWMPQDDVDKIHGEMLRWCEAHHMGRRLDIHQAHNFTKWWERFGADHPDWFAEAPASRTDEHPFPKASTVKLRISNPEVVDQIVLDWQGDGRPSLKGICPNDGGGFDTSPETMAMDYPLGQDPLDIWAGGDSTRARLATRFVKFWNQIAERIHAEKPDTLLVSLAYGRYQVPPPPEAGVQLSPNILLGLTAGNFTQDWWDAWQQRGAQMYLRPNWWYVGADAPNLPLHLEGGFHQHARQTGGWGYLQDSVLGYWGVQHLRYYLVARLGARPDKTVDDVIEEYLACFGDAADAIRAYITYWEDHTTQIAYPEEAQGQVADPNGLYQQAVRDHGVSPLPLLGSMQAIPYLFPESVVAPAREMLDQAVSDAGPDTDVLTRIQFLIDGLDQLEAARETHILGREDRTSSAFITQAGDLLEIRKQLTPRHVVWGEVAYWREQMYNLPTSV